MMEQTPRSGLGPFLLRAGGSAISGLFLIGVSPLLLGIFVDELTEDVGGSKLFFHSTGSGGENSSKVLLRCGWGIAFSQPTLPLDAFFGGWCGNLPGVLQTVKRAELYPAVFSGRDLLQSQHCPCFQQQVPRPGLQEMAFEANAFKEERAQR